MKKSVTIIIVLLVVLGLSEQRGVAVRSPENRVVGGSDAELGYAPYQVSIQNTAGEHVCGGSIVNNEWILTAAHCMAWDKEYLKVVTGTVNWTQPGAEYYLADVKIHCLHNQPTLHNDIALLRLQTPIVYDEWTRPAQLATSNTLNDGQPLVLTGWGATQVWGFPAQILQHIELRYLAHDKCAAAVTNAEWLSIGHICTLTEAGEGACQGDSGGPLVDSDQVQVGIVNWGEACARGYPDVYASVAYHHDWIRNIIAGNSIC